MRPVDGDSKILLGRSCQSGERLARLRRDDGVADERLDIEPLLLHQGQDHATVRRLSPGVVRRADDRSCRDMRTHDGEPLPVGGIIGAERLHMPTRAAEEYNPTSTASHRQARDEPVASMTTSAPPRSSDSMME